MCERGVPRLLSPLTWHNLSHLKTVARELNSRILPEVTLLTGQHAPPEPKATDLVESNHDKKSPCPIQITPCDHWTELLGETAPLPGVPI